MSFTSGIFPDKLKLQAIAKRVETLAVINGTMRVIQVNASPTRSSLRKFSLSLQSAVESVFENISKNSLLLSVTHEVGSIFVRTRVCSVNSNLMYFRGLNSLNSLL